MTSNKEKKSWIKLWIEILFDPKMVILEDDIWRKIIEILMLAGIPNDSGKLPEMRYMTRILGLSEKTLVSYLRKMEELEIVRFSDELGWFVVNYEKRQSPKTGTERSRDSRGSNEGGYYPSNNATKTLRINNKTSNENATNSLQRKGAKRNENAPEAEAEAEAEADTEVDTDTQQKAARAIPLSQEVVDLFHEHYERMTLQQRQELSRLETKYNTAWLLEAMRETERYDGKTLRYVERILESWAVSGMTKRKHQSDRNGLRGKDLDEALARIVAEAQNG